MAKPNILVTPGYELYQQLVDRVFGSGAINIKPDVDNKETGALKHVDEFSSFKANFENRLERLKAKFEGTASYADLKQTVAQVADSKNWEGAYAELVAYDVLSNDYLPDHIELNMAIWVTSLYRSPQRAQRMPRPSPLRTSPV